MKFIKWYLIKNFVIKFSIKLSTAIFCINWLAYASFNIHSFITQLKKYAKYNVKLILSIYHSSLKILNLHRKSKYQQNKNIARFLNHELRALCSFLVACTLLYTMPCPSVGQLVGLSVRHTFTFFFNFISLSHLRVY